jgi:FAD/FMN-containing dehydrogenase
MTRPTPPEPLLQAAAVARIEEAARADGALAQLRATFRGEALTPSDEGFAEVPIPFNAMHADRPGLVLRCHGTADVVAAVNFARDNGLELTVRGGGHSIAGFSSTDGGTVIDLSRMRGVEVDPEARLARVQGGALWADVDRETQLFGLATPGGLVSDTGVAGLTLGGGYGWLRRRFGLSCDNLVAAQVVCADGRVRTASADADSELLWALRGGGGNFGVVTSLTFRLHPLGPEVACAVVFHPVAEAAAVLRGFRAFATEAPDEVTAEALAITMPAAPDLPEPVHGEPCFVVAGVYAGDPAEGMEALEPLRRLGAPLADVSTPMPFTVMQSSFDAFFPRGRLRSYWKSHYLQELSDAAIDVIARACLDRPSGLTFVDTYLMGGALGRVGAGESAFGERSAPFMVGVHGNWDEATDDAEAIAWVRQAAGEIAEYGTGSTYLNMNGLVAERPDAGVGDAFGENLRRLGELKRAYDPENLFRRNNNVLPERLAAPQR